MLMNDYQVHDSLTKASLSVYPIDTDFLRLIDRLAPLPFYAEPVFQLILFS